METIVTWKERFFVRQYPYVMQVAILADSRGRKHVVGPTTNIRICHLRIEDFMRILFKDHDLDAFRDGA